MTPTADLYDLHGEALEVLRPLLRDFGGQTDATGPIATVKCHEDNSLVGQAVRSPGHGRVLVVDGGGSTRCALVGDNLAQAAIDNGWAGLVVYGCIRDAAIIATLPIMVKALGTIPRKTVKRGEGQRDVAVRFGDATFEPGRTLVADADGVVVLPPG